MEHTLKRLMSGILSAMFLVGTGCLAGIAVMEFAFAVSSAGEQSLIPGVVRAVNLALIALAVFVLGTGLGRGYAIAERAADFYALVRGTLTRFVSVVCIALVMESLLMVVESHLLGAGAGLESALVVALAAGILLACLGLFMRFTRPEPLAAAPDPRLSERLAPEARPASGAAYALFGLAPRVAREQIRS
jgi:hypothetical protein